MNQHAHFIGIKTRLASIAPVFKYTNQYLYGKDNVSFIVPAIYIEMPSGGNLVSYGRRMQALQAEIKIHLVTNSAYKNHSNGVQEKAETDHDAMLQLIDRTLTGWVIKDEDENLLSQQFISTSETASTYDQLHKATVLTYKTELINVHLAIPITPIP